MPESKGATNNRGWITRRWKCEGAPTGQRCENVSIRRITIAMDWIHLNWSEPHLNHISLWKLVTKKKDIITYSAFPEGNQTALTNDKKKLSLIAECQLISTKEMIKSEKYCFINSNKIIIRSKGAKRYKLSVTQ